jgi:PAS domain S-box-containing protein
MPLEHWEPNPPSGQDNSASSQRRLSNSAPITKPLPSPATPLPAALVPIAEAIREGTPKLSGDAARQAQQLVRDWTPEISRHGLTSTTLVRDQTASGKQPAADRELAPCQTATHHSGEPPLTRPVLQGKRPSEEEEDALNSFQQGSPALKKARLIAPGRIDLGSLPSTPDSLIPHPDLPPSPLFYSMSSKHTLGRPPSWSTSEAVASMMGGEPHKGVTTVRLPKGQIAGSPARSASTPGSWASFEFAGTTRSPDNRPLPPALQLLQQVSVIELLEQDERPTFVIDLKNPANFDQGPLNIAFANAALRASGGVIGLVLGDTADPEHSPDFSRFKAWTLSFVKNNESMDVCLPSLSYGGISWTCSTLKRRFRFISGNMSAVSITPTSPSPIAHASSVLDQRARGPIPIKAAEVHSERPASEIDYFVGVEPSSSPTSSHARSHSEPRAKPEAVLDAILGLKEDHDTLSTEPEEVVPSFDWTRIPIDTPNIPAHLAFARSVDWASTPLGPLEEWPSDLRSMSNMIMGSPHPAAMYWGPQYIAIYNEAYIPLAGQKHPQLMGMRYQDAWTEIWSDLLPYFDAAWNAGQSTMKQDDRLYVNRHGYMEETYFNWSIIPLVGGDGSVVAIYNPAFENTRRKINERRMLALNEVGEKTSQARDVKGFWTQVRQGLEYSEYDVPFALIYSVTDDSESEVSSMHSGSLANPPQISLEGSLGAPPDHPAAVASMDLRSSDEGFAPYMRDVLAHPSTPVVLRTEDGTLPEELVEGLAWRGFGDACRTIVVFPVHPTTGDSVVGFIVLGVNPRRPYDEDYELFVNLLARQLATSLASVVLFEEEIKRGQKAARLAALDRQELSLQLLQRTQEAIESEYRFTRMAEFAPVGMFIADGQGIINYCNDTWWEISRHPRSTNTMDVWMQSIRDEDRPGVEKVWQKLVNEKVSVSHEFRFKNSRIAHDGRPTDTWVLMSAYPEKDEQGELKSIFGCMTDISQQKWAENFQKLRREEALELKRQQENFIDITSHEMRNPLSAVLQCADEISESIGRYRSVDHSAYVPKGLNMLLDSCVEASNTISLCANHQKRIVDDILTLSKLDSKLLLVTPVDVQPVVVVEKVLKMFEPELRSNDIRGEFRIEQSYLDLGLDWCKLDPSRLRQVLINLMTNAIKFTTGREKRAITITLGASRDVSKSDLMYFPRRQNDQSDPTDDLDWGSGEKLSLMLAVSDTGPGLTNNEKKLLFQRFQQASPRTHVQYGGSGLGLFICRTLTELQGGQIGVQSEPATGSTFNFYIRSRRSVNPQPQLGADTPTPKASPIKPDPRPTAAKLQYSTQPVLPPPEPLVPDATSPVQDTEMQDAHRPPPLDVLIVEDNVVNQRVLSRLLKVCGNNTHVANHGVEALQVLQRSRFWNNADTETTPGDRINVSVILMDLEMPVMDGMTCARKIRELEAEGTISRHIPIIAVTAYARPQQIANAKAAGIVSLCSPTSSVPVDFPVLTGASPG